MAHQLLGPLADEILPMTLDAVPYATNNYHRAYHPVRHRYRKMRGRVQDDYVDDDVNTTDVMEEKGLVLRKRSEVQSDEEIVEVVRHRGERLPRRPGMPRQSSSMDNIRNQQVVPYRGGRDRGRNGNASDSEGSIPPRSRAGQGRSRAKSAGGKRSTSSASSSSDLGSSTEDEKKVKKIRHKKWITAGLAGVATIHAASKLYSSIEDHDKRIEEVRQGTISPEEAHKKRTRARWQDAGAIAIAALGIKGALSEWNEVQEQRHEHQELLKHHEEMHRKRLEHERRKKARGQGGYYKGRDGGWYYDGAEPQGFSGGRDVKDLGDRSRDRDGRSGGSRRRRDTDSSYQ